MSAQSNTESQFEYVVVGSGAGGGTLAARLAEEGCKVLLLEAGSDPLQLQGGGPAGEDRMPDDYKVPVFQAFAAENRAMSWEFFPRHYTSEERQEKDPKYTRDKGGVFYPRAGTLGGCTAHNAMITVYPHNEDWDYLAYLTGDSSWKAKKMRKYFQRMEDCHHRFSIYRWLAKVGINFTRHGWNGWLSTEKAIPKAALADKDLVKTILKSAHKALKKVGQPAKRIKWFFQGHLDPNDWRLVRENAVGLRYPPLATRNHARAGSRERLLDVAEKYPNNLKIELDALVTKVIFDNDNRAIGVEYLKGARLYQAHHKPSEEPGEVRTAYVSNEVILAGGAFNTPQLLMLSGVGPREELEKHKIDVRVDLPGVGANLQDRYEVGVVNRMKFHWDVLKGAKFEKGDPQYEQWSTSRKGVYTTNGAVLAVIKRADPRRLLPDLFCFAVLGKFKGYFPGFSKLILNTNYLTWAVLKAHTNNTAGRVTLRSDNPRERPEINFHYFDEGNDETGADLDAVVDGIKFVRSMTADISDLIEEEELPGKDLQSDEQLRDFVKNRAWGHHASCTCAIGPKENNGVLNGDFEVHGTKNLRVVDASVFPKIPGFFIVSSVYMIGEKAADVILEAAGKALPSGGDGGSKSFLKLLGQGFLALLLLLLLIVGSSWFYFEPNSKPKDEAKTINKTIALLQDILKHQYDPRFFRRDTHPKANACVKANFVLEPGVANDPRLNIGVFKGKPNGDRTYKAWMRFSNAANVVTDDEVEDFRGLGIKLFDIQGEKFPIPSDAGKPGEKNTQDFMFIAHNTFFAGNVQHFHDFFAACRAAGYSCAPSSLPIIWHLLTHPQGAYNSIVGRKTYRSIEEIKWFSVAPFRLGKKHVVKYGVFPPKGEKSAYDDIGTSPHYLTDRLKKTLDPASGKGFKLDFKVQFLEKREIQPIDNTLIAWHRDDSPWHKVATIDVYPQKFDSPGHWEFCQNITYNPWHSLVEHEPIGGINRARRNVMHALQELRLKQNGRARIEPTGDETF